MNEAELILLFAKIWTGFGALVALVFLSFGIDGIDEDAQGAYVFRPLLVPGILLIWPLVLWRWHILASNKDEWSSRYKPRRNSHRWIAFVMPLAIIVVIGTGLSVRQTWPVDIAPVQLSTPEVSK
ncbi:MAG: hypothetical protein ABJ327_06875 [Litoreibacter sp.]